MLVIPREVHAKLVCLLCNTRCLCGQDVGCWIGRLVDRTGRKGYRFILGLSTKGDYYEGESSPLRLIYPYAEIRWFLHASIYLHARSRVNTVTSGGQSIRIGRPTTPRPREV